MSDANNRWRINAFDQNKSIQRENSKEITAHIHFGCAAHHSMQLRQIGEYMLDVFDGGSEKQLKIVELYHQR